MYAKLWAAHDVVVLLLAQDEAELGILLIRLLVLGPKEGHDAALEEIVELDRLRSQPLHLQIVNLAKRSVLAPYISWQTTDCFSDGFV